MRSRFAAPPRGLVLACAATLVVATACQAEQRPTPGSVKTIGSPAAGGSVSASGSVSGVLPPAPVASPGAAASPGASPAAAAPSKPDGIYTPVTNREAYQAIALDYQEIAALNNRVNEGQPLPSAEILAIYDNGKHAAASRALGAFARAEARAAEFPDAAAFYGAPTFLDTPVRDAINGTGSAASYTPAQRRQAIQKGSQRIMAYWTMRYMQQARANLNPGLVDEAWAIYMGPDVDGKYPHSLSALALSREGNFSRPNSLDVPLRQAMSRAQQAAAAKDQAAYEAAEKDTYARLNAVFYLGATRYMNESLKTAQGGNAANAAVQQIEGLAFYQTIQPAVARADAAADRTIVAYLTAQPAALTAQGRDEALAAINRAATALLLTPADLVTPATFAS